MTCLMVDVIKFVNKVPKILAEKTENVSKSIGDQIHKYADLLSGEEKKEEDENAPVYMDSVHQKYLDSLRRAHKDIYMSLLDLSNSRGKTLETISQFVTNNLVALKNQ